MNPSHPTPAPGVARTTLTPDQIEAIVELKRAKEVEDLARPVLLALVSGTGAAALVGDQNTTAVVALAFEIAKSFLDVARRPSENPPGV